LNEKDKIKKHHVLITGTGRTGTTFLMTLLTNLGLDTGFSSENLQLNIYENCHAGLENIVNMPDSPYILKNLSFCDAIGKIIENPNVQIDFVFIPIREIDQAAKSRIKVYNSSNEDFAPENIQLPGGLWGTDKPEEQSRILHEKLLNLLLELSKVQIPVKFIHYPKLTKRPFYLYRKLKPILMDITFEEFKPAFKKSLNIKLVNNY